MTSETFCIDLLLGWVGFIAGRQAPMPEGTRAREHRLVAASDAKDEASLRLIAALARAAVMRMAMVGGDDWRGGR
jgi:hypothetical protein